jgi:acyl-coenzyme A thioesterase PaaI-like protein
VALRESAEFASLEMSQPPPHSPHARPEPAGQANGGFLVALSDSLGVAKARRILDRIAKAHRHIEIGTAPYDQLTLL